MSGHLGRNRAIVAAAIVSTAFAVACSDARLAGPTEVLGDPLLDIALGPGAPTLPSGSVTLNAARDTMRLTLANLPPLPSDAVYQVFLVDSVGATTAGSPNLRPVSGALIRTRNTYRPVNRDSTFVATTTDTTPGAASITTNPSFPNSRSMAHETFTLIVTGVPLANYSNVVVAVSSPVQTAASHLDPSTRRGFLHARYGDTVLVAARAVTSATATTLTSTGAGWTPDAYTNQTVQITAGTGQGQRRTIVTNTATALTVTPAWTTTPNTTSRFEIIDVRRPLRFGSFAINSASRVNFAVAGNYDGAFRGDRLILNVRQLVRPPEGFQYAVWLFNFRAGTFTRVGSLSTPPPVYDSTIMRIADVAPSGPQNFLADNYIIEATARAPVDSAQNYELITVLLEPKGASDVPDFPSLITVVGGIIPPSVTSRLPTNGMLFGKLTGPPASTQNATVYLTSGSTIPVLATASDANGDFRFRSVIPGSYTVNVIPRGDNTIRATAQVTVTRTAVAGGFRGDSVYVTIPVP